MSKLSVESAAGLLAYCPDTGRLTWLKGHGNGIVAGAEAGCARKDGYRRVRIAGRYYYAHRIAWLLANGEMPEFIDHISGDPSDNRLSNLRVASRAQNQQNQTAKRNSASGLKGVSFSERDSVWEASVMAGGRRARASFRDLLEAAAWVIRTRSALHGGFANHGGRA